MAVSLNNSYNAKGSDVSCWQKCELLSSKDHKRQQLQQYVRQSNFGYFQLVPTYTKIQVPITKCKFENYSEKNYE
jgi:hypothetical protein